MQSDECTDFRPYIKKLLKSPDYNNASDSELSSAFDYAKKVKRKK